MTRPTRASGCRFTKDIDHYLFRGRPSGRPRSFRTWCGSCRSCTTGWRTRPTAAGPGAAAGTLARSAGDRDPSLRQTGECAPAGEHPARQLPPPLPNGASASGVPLHREPLSEVVELVQDPASQPPLIVASSHDHGELVVDKPLVLFTPVVGGKAPVGRHGLSDFYPEAGSPNRGRWLPCRGGW